MATKPRIFHTSSLPDPSRSSPPPTGAASRVSSRPPAKGPPTAADEAQKLAARFGWHVLPVECRGKAPAGHLAPCGHLDATADQATIAAWFENGELNVGVSPAPSGLVVIDIDPRNGGNETFEALTAELGEIGPTVEVLTGGGGRHLYLRADADPNVSYVGTLGPGVDQKHHGYAVGPGSVHPSGKRYGFAEARSPHEIEPAEPPESWRERMVKRDGSTFDRATSREMVDPVPEGSRHTHLASKAGAAARIGVSVEAIEALVHAENAARCDPPLSDGEVRYLARDAAKRWARPTFGERGDSWPKPLGEAAFHGVAGEIVRAIEPHSEADPAAILVQFLVAFGSAAGRHAYFPVEADRHFTNLFALIVGETAKGRKGTSRKQATRTVEMTDADWAQRITTGLVSGEGLIFEVRDAVSKRRKAKNQVERESADADGYITDIEDHGVTDKRTLIIESEFASALRAAGRETSTLGHVVRQAWDGGNLRTMAKTSPARATDAHISILAHITLAELKRDLTTTDMANGFANRFLFVCARRSKLLPRQDPNRELNLIRFVWRIREALDFAAEDRAVDFSDDATKRWDALYAELAVGHPGILGDVTARAEPQILRLALTYALLDCSEMIEIEHLRAAEAVWAYCDESAQHVFGRRTGNKLADRLAAELKERPDGMTRGEIRDLVGGRVSAADIENALSELANLGVAHSERVATGGRPVERWTVELRSKVEESTTTRNTEDFAPHSSTIRSPEIVDSSVSSTPDSSETNGAGDRGRIKCDAMMEAQ